MVILLIDFRPAFIPEVSIIKYAFINVNYFNIIIEIFYIVTRGILSQKQLFMEICSVLKKVYILETILFS